MIWLPLFLKSSHNLSVLDTGWHLATVILGSFFGYLVSADLTDRFGRRPTLILFAVCSFLTVWMYTVVPLAGSSMLLLGFPLGFFASGSFSPMGSFFTELYPTALRASAQGFVYNVGRGVGALFPTLVGFLSARTSARSCHRDICRICVSPDGGFGLGIAGDPWQSAFRSDTTTIVPIVTQDLPVDRLSAPEKRRILVIDDEVDIREGLELLLTGENYQVDLAENATSRSAEIRSQVPTISCSSISCFRIARAWKYSPTSASATRKHRSSC